MKNFNLFCLGLLLLLLCACKKSGVDPKTNDESTDKTGAVEEVFPSQMFNDAEDFIPSFSGNYALIKTNSQNKQFQYSSDAGATWQELKSVRNIFAVNDKGYYIYDPPTGARQFSKLGAVDAGFSYNLTGGELILGKDDFIYDFSPAISVKKLSLINTANGQTTVVNNQADTLGKYCGQDQNGGIAFLNTKGLTIHQPRDNKFIFHPLNFVRLNFTGNNVNNASQFFYNGYDKLVVADKSGFQVYQTGKKDAIQNFTWPNPYDYRNPSKITINKNGDVFATLVMEGNIKITNGNITKSPKAAYTTCHGEYTYEMYALEAKKIGAGKTEDISGLLKEARNFKSAYITEENVYAIYPLNGPYKADIGDTVLRYNRKTKTTIPLNLSGTFSFVYSDGNRVMVSGNNVLMYSANNGETWEQVNSTITNSLVEVKKIGNTYYGMCRSITSYTSTYGTSYSNSFKMLTSTDLKNWTLLTGASYDGKGGRGPLTFTKDGFMSYISSSSGSLIFKNYSTDFGKTWQSTSNSVVLFSAETNDGKLINFNHNGGSQLYYEVYNRNGITGNLGARITYDAPTGRSFTTSTPRVPVVSENGSFYFFNDDKIFKLK